MMKEKIDLTEKVDLKEQESLPKDMQDSKIRTTVQKMSDIVKEKLELLKDMATMEIYLDTGVRMKKRLDSIKEMGSAKHIKIRGQWKTIPPETYITNLQGKKINNDEYEITFSTYVMDEKGNKKLFTNYADVELHDGSKIKRAMSSQYKIALEVKEIIKTGKPITREVIEVER